MREALREALGAQHDVGSGLIDERDLLIIDALQLDPRARWVDVASALGMTPLTAARRWAALQAAGMAWTGVAIGESEQSSVLVSIVEVSCRPGAGHALTEWLTRMPEVVTVNQMTGACDLSLVVMLPSLADLATFRFEVLGRRAEVDHVRIHVCPRLFGGGVWRMRALDPSQARTVLGEKDRPREVGALVRPMGPDDAPLLEAIGVDGRLSAAGLARRLGTSPYRASRRLNDLLRGGHLRLRCDFARPLGGWHALVDIRLDVPRDRVVQVGQALRGWPESRFCASVVGAPNLVALLGVRSIADVERLTEAVSSSFPDCGIVDQRVVLRQAKAYGRVLDEAGRAVLTVPVNPWAGLRDPDW